MTFENDDHRKSSKMMIIKNYQKWWSPGRGRRPTRRQHNPILSDLGSQPHSPEVWLLLNFNLSSFTTRCWSSFVNIVAMIFSKTFAWLKCCSSSRWRTDARSVRSGTHNLKRRRGILTRNSDVWVNLILPFNTDYFARLFQKTEVIYSFCISLLDP